MSIFVLERFGANRPVLGISPDDVLLQLGHDDEQPQSEYLIKSSEDPAGTLCSADATKTFLNVLNFQPNKRYIIGNVIVYKTSRRRALKLVHQ